MEVCEVLEAERADVAQPESKARGRATDSIHVPITERPGGSAGTHVIAILDRDRHLQGTRRCHEASDGGRGRSVQAQGAAQQRSPREADRDEVGESRQIVRQHLHPGRYEDGVRKTALVWISSRPAGGLRHGVGIGVDPDGQGRGIGGRCREDGAAVAGSQVDDGPAMSPGQSGQLADVDLDDPAAGHDAHGAQYAISPSSAPG
jgi:hypothetical protein